MHKKDPDGPTAQPDEQPCMGRSFINPEDAPHIRSDYDILDELGNLLKSSVDILGETHESLSSTRFGALYLLRQAMVICQELKERRAPGVRALVTEAPATEQSSEAGKAGGPDRSVDLSRLVALFTTLRDALEDDPDTPHLWDLAGLGRDIAEKLCVQAQEAT